MSDIPIEKELANGESVTEAYGGAEGEDLDALVGCRVGRRMFPPSCPNPGDSGDPALPYRLDGAQVEPEAGWWGIPVLERELPRVVSVDTVRLLVENPNSPFFVPPYPRDPAFLRWEVAELAHLESLRDDPTQVAGTFGTTAPANDLPAEYTDTTRLPVSEFIQLDPPPFGAIFNIATRRQFVINNINQQHLRRQAFQSGSLPPVVRTGRELGRMFEAETPGLIHHNALHYLLYKRPEISPPRQARIWMALNTAIYSALNAAWYYKWAAPQSISYRQRPYEFDQNATFRVLYDDVVDNCGRFNKCPRPQPCPSPGTPRHPALPSGHSTYSAAASAVLSYFFPEERQELERLADNIGTARLWAGVHWRTDHVAGQRIGRAVAYLIIRQLQGDCVSRFDDVIIGAPEQGILEQRARQRRTQEDCDANQDRVPTQRPTPFDDCNPSAGDITVF